MRDRIIEILRNEIDDCNGDNCDKDIPCAECERDSRVRIGKIADEIINVMKDESKKKLIRLIKVKREENGL